MATAASNSDSRILQVSEVEVKTKRIPEVNVRQPAFYEPKSSDSACSTGGKTCSSGGEGSSEVGLLRARNHPCHVVAPSTGDKDGDLLPVIMINDSDKNMKIKMGLKKDVRMRKAMKKFASRFDADYKKLSFVLEKTETNVQFTLTGNELVEDVKGGCIKVLGVTSDHRKI